MGKIADRFTLKRRLNHAPGGASGVIRQGGTPTLDRIQRLLSDIANARSGSHDTMARHERMSALANEARGLGLKGRYMQLCNRTQCLAPNADWYNRGSYAFYCEDCAHMLNHANRHDEFCKGEPLCRLIETAEEAAKLHVMP